MTKLLWEKGGYRLVLKDDRIPEIADGKDAMDQQKWKQVGEAMASSFLIVLIQENLPDAAQAKDIFWYVRPPAMRGT